jgi:hypothetical protein
MASGGNVPTRSLLTDVRLPLYANLTSGTTLSSLRNTELYLSTPLENSPDLGVLSSATPLVGTSAVPLDDSTEVVVGVVEDVDANARWIACVVMGMAAAGGGDSIGTINQSINQSTRWEVGDGRREEGQNNNKQQGSRTSNNNKRRRKRGKKKDLQAPTGIEPVISCLLGKRFAI